jgi:hypothetical protein
MNNSEQILPRLKPKQALFVSKYLECSNSAEAARLSGYSVKCARAIGNRLLRNVNVSKHLQWHQEKLAEETQLTIESIVLKIFHLATTAKSELTRLKALDLLMRHLGGYRDILERLPDDQLDELYNKLTANDKSPNYFQN